jgi:hypothetical protein
VGNLELAKTLMDKGADAFAANVQGDTPLGVSLNREMVCQLLTRRKCAGF